MKTTMWDVIYMGGYDYGYKTPYAFGIGVNDLPPRAEGIVDGRRDALAKREGRTV